jgi:hypothetical protein
MFFKKVGGRCGCVYGTKGAVDRKSLRTTALYEDNTRRIQKVKNRSRTAATQVTCALPVKVSRLLYVKGNTRIA